MSDQRLLFSPISELALWNAKPIPLGSDLDYNHYLPRPSETGNPPVWGGTERRFAAEENYLISGVALVCNQNWQ